MASDNTILTALGLDVSQFEKGAAKGTRATNALLGAISSVDIELRKIPVIGELYSATFGKIAEGFAQTRIQARAFAQTMQTDVSGSLEGTMGQIEEINGQLKELKEGSFSRSISDALSNTSTIAGRSKNAALSLLGFSPESTGAIKAGVAASATAAFKQAQQVITSLIPGGKLAAAGAKGISDIIGPAKIALGFGREQAIREQQINELEVKKTQNIQNVIGLLQQESAARSSLVSGSELESENARSYLEMRQRILAVVQQAQKIGGPDSAKWNAEIQKSVGDQANLYVEIYNKQVAAADARSKTRAEELNTAAKIADLQAHGNEREIAAEEKKLALLKLENAQKSDVREEINAATAELAIANSRTEQAEHQYRLSLRQLNIETQVMDAQTKGQTRLAKQLEIQARYEIQISEATRTRQFDLARELAAQAKLAQLQEAMRQYELGGRGRANERRNERRNARRARVVASRLAERELSQTSDDGLRTGKLSTGSPYGRLTSGGLSRPKAGSAATPQLPPLSETQQFRQKILEALSK